LLLVASVRMPHSRPVAGDKWALVGPHSTTGQQKFRSDVALSAFWFKLNRRSRACLRGGGWTPGIPHPSTLLKIVLDHRVQAQEAAMISAMMSKTQQIRDALAADDPIGTLRIAGRFFDRSDTR